MGLEDPVGDNARVAVSRRLHCWFAWCGGLLVRPGLEGARDVRFFPRLSFVRGVTWRLELGIRSWGRLYFTPPSCFLWI